MNMIQTSCNSFRLFIISTLLIILVNPAALNAVEKGREQIGKKEATESIISLGENIWAKADRSKGLRIHQYGELLPKGARVGPAFTPEGKEPLFIVCEHPCWLFFIDEQPGAHFAHPGRIVLLDAVTGEEKVIQTDWWPQVDGKPIFDKVGERDDPKTIIFDEVPEIGLRGKEPDKIIGGPSLQIKTHDPCDAWAVIVCGFDDIPDTFDEDTDDVYSVLIGLGLLDDHIFFVSPHTGHAGVDGATSIANVQWAINQVAASADETDKVLFFYSSHGGVDSLSCVPGSPGGGNISAADLDNWLDGITCDELVIIIEACHSGSLIGSYANGTYVATEDDLTGDGETNRCVFTSASHDTSSYPDRDWPGDPNPGDVGSETIHGYVEAFSTAAADGNGDGEISFGEGWQYAWDNDITRITGVNTPQMIHTGLNVAYVYDYCYRVSGAGDLFISDGPGDVGHNSYDYDSTDIWVTQDPAETDHHDIVSGMDNLVNVAVHNRGTTPIANTSLNVYWAEVSTATSWPGDFHQIGATYAFSSLGAGATHTHTWTWYVDPSIGLGHNFCLVAVADSPADPMTGGPSGVTYVAPYDNNIGQKNVTIIEDPGHGYGKFDFVLKNNTRESDKVDLVIEWVGDPWGTVTLALPDELFDFVQRGATELENLKIVDSPEGKVTALEVTDTGKNGGRMRGIPLKPGETKIISLSMKTRKTNPGDRSELRLRQEVDGTIIGVVTVRIKQVDPSDCGWVARRSVEAFADLALKYEIPSAKEVSQLFAKAITAGVCRDRKEFLEVLKRALSLEVDAAKGIPRKANPEAQKMFATGLDELEISIKNRDVENALRAQGRISEVLENL